MMKKLTVFILLLICSVSFAQYTINGTIEPFAKDIKWVMLYQIKEGRQHYVKNSKIENKKFRFELPKDAPYGMYRIVYRLKGTGFLDFIFNKEDIDFKFHPDYPEETVVFSKSDENNIYQQYLGNVLLGQQYLDSIQLAYFNNPSPVSATNYQEAYFELKDIQKEFEYDARNLLALDFIEATERYNAAKVVENPQVYLENIKKNFFKHIDFNNKTLINSSFLVDRVIDYVFNLNYSKDPKISEKLYKESIQNVMAIQKANTLQKDLIQIIISEFVNEENVTMVNHMFDNYYDRLPKELQSKTYKEETLAQLQIILGALAPDFLVKADTQLSQLNTHKYYVLVFWSTGCSHCTSQLPKLYEKLNGDKNIQVVAVALEKEDNNWKKISSNFKGWEHVLALGKWKNTIARSYNIESTPTYIVLNANKRIIALPDNDKELNEVLPKLQ